MKRNSKMIDALRAIPDLNRGCYQLWFDLRKSSEITIGRTARLVLTPGTYIYTGRHVRALKKRLLRHLQPVQKKYWHIDYISHHADLELSSLVIFPGTTEECRINQYCQRVIGSVVVKKGLGSGDCRAGCGSHFLYLPSRSTVNYHKWIEMATEWISLLTLDPYGNLVSSAQKSSETGTTEL